MVLPFHGQTILSVNASPRYHPSLTLDSKLRAVTDLQKLMLQRPSLLRSICDSTNQTKETSSSSKRHPSKRYLSKSIYNPQQQTCSCNLRGARKNLRLWSHTQAGFSIRASHLLGCPLYAISPQSFQAYVSVPSPLFSKYIQLSFNATSGAGGLSISPHLSIASIREDFALIGEFFYNLYRKIYLPPWRSKSVDELLDHVEEALTLYYSSGAASPSDVDSLGRTLININLNIASRVIYRITPMDSNQKQSEFPSRNEMPERLLQLLLGVIQILRQMGTPINNSSSDPDWPDGRVR